MMSDISAGTTAGVIAAAISGLLLQLTKATAPDGTRTTLIAMAARIARSNHSFDGWLVVLVYGAVIGMLFGWLARGRRLTTGVAIIGGAFYGAGWWIVSGLVLVPAILGRIPLSAAAVDLMRPMALSTMIESALYGVVLGAAFTVIAERLRRREGRRRISISA